jgi:hypothetical protein
MIGNVDFSSVQGPMIDEMLRPLLGGFTHLAILVVLAAIAGMALLDRRLRQRRRLVASAIAMGLSVAAAWLISSFAVDNLLMDRPEALSFVAPVGRGLGQFMMDAFRNTGFGVATAAGVVAASMAVSLLRREFRWEAFDDPLEMRRHLGGGALMAIGGVLAQGCTIGQGLSAASTLTITAPVFMVSVLLGAKLGLLHLIEGRSLWRLGRS